MNGFGIITVVTEAFALVFNIAVWIINKKKIRSGYAKEATQLSNLAITISVCMILLAVWYLWHDDSISMGKNSILEIPAGILGLILFFCIVQRWYKGKR